MSDASTPPPAHVPPAETPLNAHVVRRLLAAQHRDLAHLPIAMMSEGWDNAIFRVGDALLARLPRRAVAAPLIRHEQVWLPRLAPRLPVPVSAPVRIGAPDDNYPFPWSITPFLSGKPVGAAGLRADQGPMLGRFFRALHEPAPPDAPANAHRGVPLRARLDGDVTRLARLGALAPDFVREAIQAAIAAPLHDGPPQMLHGDPHPFNILAEDGRLTAVIDWGDLCAGDPASDLAALWMLLPEARARAAAIDAYGGLPSALHTRARGWAASFAILFLEIGQTNGPHFGPVAEAVIARLSAP